MNSLIFRTATQYLTPLLALYSVYLLFEGHHKPGGGFVGGLMAAAAFALCVLAYDVPATRRMLRIEPVRLISIGLLIIAASGSAALFRGEPFLTGYWGKLPLSRTVTLELGTPQVFDIGVYLIVVGVTMKILFTFAEEEV